MRVISHSIFNVFSSVSLLLSAHQIQKSRAHLLRFLANHLRTHLSLIFWPLTKNSSNKTTILRRHFNSPCYQRQKMTPALRWVLDLTSQMEKVHHQRAAWLLHHLQLLRLWFLMITVSNMKIRTNLLELTNLIQWRQHQVSATFILQHTATAMKSLWQEFP